MHEVPIPGVDAIENEVIDPAEWIEATGAISYVPRSRNRTKTQCEDCLQLILDHINGRVLTRAPGLAHDGRIERRQGKHRAALCEQHASHRQKEGR